MLFYDCKAKKLKKGVEKMSKQNPYATNSGGVIKAPHPVKDQPKATTKNGGKKDLRTK